MIPLYGRGNTEQKDPREKVKNVFENYISSIMKSSHSKGQYIRRDVLVWNSEILKSIFSGVHWEHVLYTVLCHSLTQANLTQVSLAQSHLTWPGYWFLFRRSLLARAVREPNRKMAAEVKWPDLAIFVSRFCTNSTKSCGKITKSGHSGLTRFSHISIQITKSGHSGLQASDLASADPEADSSLLSANKVGKSHLECKSFRCI